MEAVVKTKKYLAVIFGSVICIGGFYFTYRQFYQQNDQMQAAEIIFDDNDEIALSLLQDISQDLFLNDHAIDDDILNQNVSIIEDLVIDIPQHLFAQLDTTIFATPEERQQFFMQQGIDYCNETVVEYEPLFSYNIKQSERYINNQDEHDLLTALYDDDLVLKTLTPMSIRWINQEVGHGIFAEDDLPAGEFIGIYGGVVKDRQLVDSKDYAWAYPEETLEGGRMTLDAKYKGNELRLINDGKDPNCIVKYILGSDGLWHVCYLAFKDIKKGDQLLVSYGPAYWDTRKYGYQELVGKK